MSQVVEKTRRDSLSIALDSAINHLDQPMPVRYSSACSLFSETLPIL
jgi:hypothetical protein